MNCFSYKPIQFVLKFIKAVIHSNIYLDIYFISWVLKKILLYLAFNSRSIFPKNLLIKFHVYSTIHHSNQIFCSSYIRYYINILLCNINQINLLFDFNKIIYFSLLSISISFYSDIYFIFSLCLLILLISSLCFNFYNLSFYLISSDSYISY